ncbi:L,D-transpeptidase family protein [Actibacterium lipolyticum]|uniref:L,D-transpeptidase catalytic domain n=1 Tax=Actibacterium lipolyticum TaxID=1524263 RepID=A0A238KVZ9_9RHOB|nr:L,D-transpeptidase family protein [Actibacterium lipolyticum]SMX47003.1 L,D-transpeptidase catalytic domain [Actibacterium lipolyticum]
MIKRRGFFLSGAALALTGCSSPSIRSYDGPEVTRIVVMKSHRKMYLLHHQKVLKGYPIALGFAPNGHKQVEGDGKTPEGRYFIDRRNPNSNFHLSLGISYPNQADVARAQAMGKSPGGDIFIHGRARKHRGKGPDWTAGCISLKDGEIEDVYSMVRVGTAIDIFP